MNTKLLITDKNNQKPKGNEDKKNEEGAVEIIGPPRFQDQDRDDDYRCRLESGYGKFQHLNISLFAL